MSIIYGHKLKYFFRKKKVLKYEYKYNFNKKILRISEKQVCETFEIYQCDDFVKILRFQERVLFGLLYATWAK